MKKPVTCLFMVAACLLLSSTAFAEFGKSIETKGFRLGVAMANAQGVDAGFLGEDPKINTGATASGYLTFRISDRFALQPELAFTTKGYQISTGSNKLTTTLHYIELPVVVKFQSDESLKVRPSIFIGPVMSVRIAENSTVLHSNLALATSAEDSVMTSLFGLAESNTKALDYGLTMGVDFHVRDASTIVDFRYTWGARRIDGASNRDIRNGSLAFTIGYAF